MRTRMCISINIRPLFSAAVSQAITDSLADQKPRIMGSGTPR
jgi:hypothetical protein